MRILVIGDTHGNSGWTNAVMNDADRFGFDTVVQVGDFGFWPHAEWGKLFLHRVNEMCAEREINLHWIDGNHENFDVLYDTYVQGEFDRPHPILSNITYIPRGHAWNWDGVRFMGFGGAYSIDKNRRTLGVSYWKQELPTDDDVCRAILNGPVDILFSHDSPYLTRMYPLLFPEKHEFADSKVSQGMVERVVEAVRPKLMVHGHYHFPYKTEVEIASGDVVKVIGLDADVSGGLADSYTIIDTLDWKE